MPAHHGLRVETVVRTCPGTDPRPLRFEARRIALLCVRPRSVAELSVALRLPLGVTRVLVADLVTDGFVVCDEPGDITVELLERILDRVRAL